MWLSKTTILLFLVGWACCEKEEDQDMAGVFADAVRSLFANKDTLGDIKNMASAFVQPNAAPKQMGDMAAVGKSGASSEDGLGQVLSSLGNLFTDGGQNHQGVQFLNSIVNGFTGRGTGKRIGRDAGGQQNDLGINFESLLNMGSTLFGQSANSDVLMGLLPMLLDGLGGGGGEGGDTTNNIHDHSGHAWFLPPILESIHVMWEHFSNSELGQTLWKTSGLNKIVAQMSDSNGQIQYAKILDSFENPSLRRRWIKSLTNYVAEWISHISDPMIQQRYLTTAQFVGNSFLKSQGFPKSAMFDSTRPAESISRLVNAVAKRHLGMKVESSQYIKPAIAYIQELIALASEKGFIMSRINARELSNRLSDTINNDIVAPILKAYRAYKWAVKEPQCASQILCAINEKTKEEDTDALRLRATLSRMASFPAAWAVSNKSGINFWSLYGAVMEQEGCIRKYPANCTDYHEEEIRVTTEAIHNEL